MFLAALQCAIFTMHNVAGMPVSLPARAATAFIDCAPESERSAFVACYVRSLDPRTETEFALATAMAEARWRIECVRKFDMVAINLMFRRMKSLAPHADQDTVLAMALASLADRGFDPRVMDHLESRYYRQYTRARARLVKLRREPLKKMEAKRSEPKPGQLLTTGDDANIATSQPQATSFL